MQKNIIPFLLGIFFMGFSSQLYAQKKQLESRSITPQTTNKPVVKKVEKVSFGEVAEKLKQYSVKNVPIPSQGNNTSPYKSIAPIFPYLRPEYVEQVYSDRETGLPIFIQGEAGVVDRTTLNSDEAIEQAVFKHLGEMKRMLQIKDPKNEFEIQKIQEDEYGYIHAKLQQVYMGVPVYGAEMNVHFEPNGAIYVNTRHAKTPYVKEIIPTLTGQSAIESGKKSLSTLTTIRELTRAEKDLLKYEAPEAELILYKKNGLQYNLTYHITLRPNLMERWEYFVDAHTGQVLHSYDHTCSMGPVTRNGTHLNGNGHTVHSFQLSNGQFSLVDASKDMYRFRGNANPPNPDAGHGVIITLDMKNTNPQNDDVEFEEIRSGNNTWNQLDLSAHVNAGIAYDYFRNTFNWQSIDGEGGDIISFINVSDENGRGFDNAFWNGAAMFYGNGDVAFSALAGSVDVGGHEMGHGVIQATANLVYQDEPGALNESYADIFGAMIDRDDWKLGEDVVNRNIFRSGALRDMQNPNNGGRSLNDNGYQPASVSEQFRGDADNGGVHINSGINNRAYYLVATAIGKDRAERIYFDALRFELNRSSNFIDMRLAAEKSASKLYGQAEINAVRSAYDQVGIIPDAGGGGGAPIPEDLDVNPGQDFIISEDINSQDPSTLYISTTAPTNANDFQAISQTIAKRPISITDNGQVGYFVGENDDNVYRIFTNPSISPQEIILFVDLAIWDNVAISKSGNRLATVSVEEDSAIYVWDLSTAPNVQGRKFSLFNPTTSSDGSVTRNVRFADAIQWDNTGEFILYDAFNSLTNNTGDNIDYWDVGLLKAWDNSTGTFGDGSIQKVFTQLPEGVSVGNGSFSKNSPTVFVFDLYDVKDPTNQFDDEFFVLAANIETGDIGTIAQNNTFGFPSYSKLDNAVVFGALDGSNNDEVKIVGLAADKLNGNTQAASLISVARFPVWYTIGDRVTSIDNNLEENNQLKVFPNPFSDNLTIEGEIPSQLLNIRLYNLVGQQLLNRKVRFNGSYDLAMENLSKGVYMLEVSGANFNGKFKVVKE